MKMNKLLQLLVVCCFVFSCTQDTFEEQKVEDTNSKIADSQYDNSHLGVYKGLFTTVDGLTRGSVVVTLSPTNEGIAQITLSSGEMIELKSNRIKLTADNTVSNLRFSSAGLSAIDAFLDFSVQGDGNNPIISNVSFDNKESDILIAKNLSRSPLTPITGTYDCTDCAANGVGFPNGRTWNVMAIGTGDQNFAVQIAYGGRVYNTPASNNMQDNCSDFGGYTTCDIAGTARILGHDVSWSGTHAYATANNETCSEVSGDWSAPTFGGGVTGTFVSDNDCTSSTVINDLCENATPISDGQSISGSTDNSTSSDAPTGCSDDLTTGPGIWFTYTAGATIDVIVNTVGSDYDTKLGVFSGSCGTLTCVDSNDDIDFFGGNYQSEVQFSAVSGETYYFYVTGFSTNSGNYVVNLTELYPPANDLCSNATPILCGETASGNTIVANNVGVPTSACNGLSFNTAGGVWYSFTTPTAKVVTADTAGSNFDTKLAVYSGSCGALVCVTGNDQGAGLGDQSRVVFSAAANETYYLYVTGYQSNTGSYVLNIASCDDALANDQCSGALPILCGASATGSTATATTIGAPANCNTSLNTSGGVWYSFSTPTLKDVTVNTVGSAFDTKLGVFSGTCNGLVCVGGNDDGPTGVTPQSQVVFTAQPNTTYYFYVTGYAANVGDYTLNVTCANSIFAPGCNESFVDNGGPSANYANNRNDTYTLDAGAGMKLSLPFTTFNLESTYDFLRLYNSPDGITLGTEITSVGTRVIYVHATNPSRVGFTGTGTGANSLQGQTVVSTGRYLIAKFTSDGSSTRAGFLATIGCITARSGDDSHIKTADTFMPAASPSTPKLEIDRSDNEAKRMLDYERHKLQNYNRMLQEAEKRELNSRRVNNKKVLTDAEKAEYLGRNN